MKPGAAGNGGPTTREMTAEKTRSDSSTERGEEEWSLEAALNGEIESRPTGRVGPERYPYEDVADAFLWAASERGLTHGERLRAIADLFEIVSEKIVYRDKVLKSRREAWLVLGYITLVTEGGTDGMEDLLTDEEIEAASEIVALIKKEVATRPPNWDPDPAIELGDGG